MAGDRVNITIPNETGYETLTVSIAASYGVVIENRDGTARDLTTDTLTVAAKLDTTTKTLVFAADANQTTTGKGKATLTIPAAQLGAAGTLYVDLMVTKSGGSANIGKRLQWTVIVNVTA